MALEGTDCLDKNGAVAPGIRCEHCQYDLRGRSPKSDCPECGRPILPDLRTRMMREEDSISPARLLPIGLTLLPALPLMAYGIHTTLMANDDGMGVFYALVYASLGSLGCALLSLSGCLYSVYWGKAWFGMFLCLALAYFFVLAVLCGAPLIF